MLFYTHVFLKQKHRLLFASTVVKATEHLPFADHRNHECSNTSAQKWRCMLWCSVSVFGVHVCKYTYLMPKRLSKTMSFVKTLVSCDRFPSKNKVFMEDVFFEGLLGSGILCCIMLYVSIQFVKNKQLFEQCLNKQQPMCDLYLLFMTIASNQNEHTVAICLLRTQLNVTAVRKSRKHTEHFPDTFYQSH